MEKLSMSRTEAFNLMPTKHWEDMDERLVKSLKHEHLIDEDEVEAKDRELQAEYGAAQLKSVFNPRYIRDRSGQKQRVVQRLDPGKLDPDRTVGLHPVDPDPIFREMDYVALLQDAITNAERERTKYAPHEQQKRTRRRRFTPTEN
jgi:hypothetical protein